MTNTHSRSPVHFLLSLSLAIAFAGCGAEDRGAAADDPPPSGSLLEPPGHAPGEPHPFTECPEGACAREQPAYLFSGEFHETVVDLRVAGCGVGLDLVWARRYRSRLPLPDDQTPIGNNWDHSYNIYLHIPEPDASDSPITIHDGNARPARFARDLASGSWTAPGYHREGTFEDDGRFVLRFADGGKWVFKSAEHSARSDIRRLAKIIDRNGNVVDLDYDDADRLERVVNSSGQSLELDYDQTGHIVAVVAKLDAQTERRVSYEHYQPGDVGGNPFDLARVNLPPIVDTVTDNDFPDGTSTIYTYSTGSGIPALDGNLLTITDGLGRVYLRNSYASSTDPDEFEFDHLVSQVWGDADDSIVIDYVPVSPTGDNGRAVRKAWLNDRVGRVTEHFFNADNQLVLLREYTGFAAPGRVSDGVDNRPTGKLRADDPLYFETRYTYNEDGHVTQIVHPGGDLTISVYEGDINPDAPARIRGNLRATHHDTGACEGDPLTISERYEYAEDLGNEHGELNFVVRAEDPRGNVTLASYDDAGNRTSIIHPEPNIREDMQFDASGRLVRRLLPEDQHGRRREIVHIYADHQRRRTTIEDPQDLALTTVHEYDAACNEIRRVDPRGADTLYTYNQRDQLIRELGPLEVCAEACGGGDPVRTATDRHYDQNGNLVRVDQQARDCDGSLQGDGVVATHYEYDVLDELIATRTELGDGSEIVTEFVLDANREQIELRHGEATAGADPFNTLTTVYDERGLLYRETRGQGSEIASTIAHHYDLDGNEIATIEGLEGASRTTTYSYDCVDRLIATVDPMGNRTELDYDAAGNVIERRVFGELDDVPGGAHNTLLELEAVIFDAMNRPTSTTLAHFDPTSQAPIGDGRSSTTLIYDGESRVIEEIDDNGYRTSHDFDAAGRRSKIIDPAGNIVEFVHDTAGNVIERIETDVASDGGDPEVEHWNNSYDARNNLIAASDPLGSTTYSCYDSLGRATAELDARGNKTMHSYDDAGRLLESRTFMTDNGSGAGMILDTVTVRQLWDHSDRLIAREDPNGNVTTYQYDSLNRLVAEIFADGTELRSSYDVHDNVVVRDDANGTVATHSYDALNRLIEVAVDPGPTIDAGTSLESYGYDGRSLLVRADDDDSTITRAYDSLGALVAETQALVSPQRPPLSRTVTYVRDGLGNPTLTVYPSGRRIVRAFDGLRRTRLIAESDEALVRFDYRGPELRRKQVLPLGLRSDYSYDADRRMTGSRHTIDGEILDDRIYEYDDAGNKRLIRDVGPDRVGGTQQVAHDSLNRSLNSKVTDSPAGDRHLSYGFDKAGNRTLVLGDDACAGTYEQYEQDALVNQYTSTPCELWSHDAAGNLIETRIAGVYGLARQLSHDHRDRLVAVATGDADDLRFAYDVLGRKIMAWRAPNQAVHFVYDGWNLIEEYTDDGPAPAASYLYGDGLDQRLEMRRGASWWYLDDELGSAVALVHRDQDHQLTIERYAYRDYGEPLVFLDGEPLTESFAQNPYLYAGGRWLPDARLYDFRTRHFDPVAGRFISRDRLGVWGDEENLGNGYTYVGNTPDTHTDPTGEFKKPNIKGCHAGARSDIEAALEEAEAMARAGRHWLDGQAKRKRTRRKKDWNRNKSDVRKWWGRYNDVRFHRIKWNFRKIVRRCSNSVITFKCRSTGDICGKGKAVAWTTSSWHSPIRLCKNEKGGFFRSSGELSRAEWESGVTVLHEASHNINAIGDKKIGKEVMGSIAEAIRFAKQHPAAASWNAPNYQYFGSTR